MALLALRRWRVRADEQERDLGCFGLGLPGLTALTDWGIGQGCVTNTSDGTWQARGRPCPIPFNLTRSTVSEHDWAYRMVGWY